MAYDLKLAQRVASALENTSGMTQKKMFGGLCFLHHGNMLCGVTDDKLMARVGVDQYEDCLQRKYVSEMTFTGSPMKGLVFVYQDGLRTSKQLEWWLEACLFFTKTLPKKPKTKLK